MRFVGGFRLLLLLFIISSTIIGTTENSCENLEPTMDIGNMIQCKGDILDVETESKILDISRFNDDQAHKLLNGEKDRILASSLTVHKSDIKTLDLKIRTDNKFFPKYTITDNNELEVFTTTGSYIKAATVIIKGNKKLDEQTIEDLDKFFENRNTTASNIQSAHECRMVNSYVEIYSYLSGCGYFDGDLEINGKTQGELPEQLDFSKIQGCLRIKDTKITSVEFLNKLTKPECPSSSRNEITGNKDLCLTSEQVFNLRDKLGDLEYNENNNCTDVCTPQWAYDKRNDANIICHTIEGSIFISGGKNSEDYEYLLNTEIVNGHIDVGHNSFTNFSFLSNIKKIYSNDKEKPSLFIHDNPNLNTLHLSLEKVYNPKNLGYDILIKDNNPNFTLPEKDYIFLKKLATINAPFKASRRKDSKESQIEEISPATSAIEGTTLEKALGIIFGMYGGGIVLALISVIAMLCYGCIDCNREE